MTRVLLALFVLAWVLTAFFVVGAMPVLAVAGTLVLFALPGWACTRTWIGALCGLVVSATLNAVLVFFLGWHVVLTIFSFFGQC